MAMYQNDQVHIPNISVKRHKKVKKKTFFNTGTYVCWCEYKKFENKND
jgi:hypothetical protein